MAKSTKCSWWLVVIGLPPYKNLPGSKIIIKRLFNEEGFKVKWGGWAIFMTAGHYGGAVSSPTPSPWKDAVSPWSPRMCTHWLVFCLLSLAEETLWQLLVRWKCDLRSHGLSSQWNSPGQNIGVGSRSLLQGIFLTQGLNPGLPHCRQILYQLNHQGSPRILEWVAYISSPGDLPDTGLEAEVSCIAGRFFTAEPPGKPRKYYGNKWPNWKFNELS